MFLMEEKVDFWDKPKLTYRIKKNFFRNLIKIVVQSHSRKIVTWGEKHNKDITICIILYNY